MLGAALPDGMEKPVKAHARRHALYQRVIQLSLLCKDADAFVAERVSINTFQMQNSSVNS